MRPRGGYGTESEGGVGPPDLSGGEPVVTPDLSGEEPGARWNRARTVRGTPVRFTKQPPVPGP
ncbi:hypothetical protein GCM10010498_05300 [Streptomyces cavourensis]|nr:hypothetical protein GCM10010498_05300 [Streptomyces cavourensis]